MRRLVAILCFVMVGLSIVGPAQAQQQQEVPEEVRRELQRRGLTVEEARERARQLGIDPSRPEEAAQRARELGVPESQIQLLLEVARTRSSETDEAQMLGQTSQPERPRLSGTPSITPDSIEVDDLPETIEVEVSLRTKGATIRRVEPFFLTAGGDSVNVRNVERIFGSVIDGTWRGSITIPADTLAGTWTLFTRVSTRDTTTTFPTGRRLIIFPQGELADEDEDRRAQRDSLRHFGYAAFNTIPEAFLPSANGPVGDDYVVGPNDELRLTVWGGAEFTYDLQVDRGGRVTVPNVGQFTVSGKRLSTLRREMKQWLSRSYAGLTSNPPSVFMDLMITRVRPIQVYVLGEVAQPGGYVLNSFATVFNALYSVGGPLKSGSLRNIRVIRNGEVIQTVDVYDYLLKGYSENPVQLQSNDHVFIPSRGETVSIRGAVKRPAIYEMREDETMRDLLEYAGGLKAEAYSRRFQVARVIPFEEREDPSVAREVTDHDLLAVRSGSKTVPLFDGDQVRIRSIREATDPVLNTEIQAVEITGAVFQPGSYALSDSLRTIRDLIEHADGMTGDAYRTYAEFTRVESDLMPSSRGVDLEAVMEDVPTENLVLRPGDSLHVASVRQMQSDRFVRITGQVRRPDTYRFRDGMTVRDLLLRGGGLMDEQYRKKVFMERADLFRVSPDGSREEVIPFHLGDALQDSDASRRALRAGDEIRVYPATVERLEKRYIQVSGAVKEPGELVFQDNMTLRDALLQAGGFSEGASLEAVEVTRMAPDGEDRGRRAVPISVPLADEAARGPVDCSVRDTSRVLQAGDGVQLQRRDRVFVRQSPSFQPQRTIVLNGEVVFPGEYTLLRENERLSSVIQRAGGVRPTGYLKGGRLLRNGEQIIIEMERALRGNPDDDVILREDDEIFVPTQPNTVAIRGNVANEGLVKFQRGKRVDYYLQRAGGTREDTEAIFLTQASGATFRVRTGWFRRTPKVDDGAIIRVTEEPPKPEGERIDVGETVSNITGILTSALTIVVLATRALN